MHTRVCIPLEVHVLKVGGANFMWSTFWVRGKGNTGCTSGTAILMRELGEHEASTECYHKTEGHIFLALDLS